MFAPRRFRSFRMAIPLWLKEKLFQKNLLKGELKHFAQSFNVNRLLFCEHHLSHAASAFYPSPFEDDAVLTMDGVGEWATTSAAMGSGKNLTAPVTTTEPTVKSSPSQVTGVAPYPPEPISPIPKILDIRPKLLVRCGRGRKTVVQFFDFPGSGRREPVASSDHYFVG